MNNHVYVYPEVRADEDECRMCIITEEMQSPSCTWLGCIVHWLKVCQHARMHRETVVNDDDASAQQTRDDIYLWQMHALHSLQVPGTSSSSEPIEGPKPKQS